MFPLRDAGGWRSAHRPVPECCKQTLPTSVCGRAKVIKCPFQTPRQASASRTKAKGYEKKKSPWKAVEAFCLVRWSEKFNSAAWENGRVMMLCCVLGHWELLFCFSFCYFFFFAFLKPRGHVPVLVQFMGQNVGPAACGMCGINYKNHSTTVRGTCVLTAKLIKRRPGCLRWKENSSVRRRQSVYFVAIFNSWGVVGAVFA